MAQTITEQPHQQAAFDIQNTPVTLSSVILITTLLAAIFSFTKILISLTNKASDIKNNFERMDTEIKYKLDNLTDRIEAGFIRIDKEWTRLDKRILVQDTRIKDVELYLFKQGFTIRGYLPEDENPNQSR